MIATKLLVAETYRRAAAVARTFRADMDGTPMEANLREEVAREFERLANEEAAIAIEWSKENDPSAR